MEPRFPGQCQCACSAAHLESAVERRPDLSLSLGERRIATSRLDSCRCDVRCSPLDCYTSQPSVNATGNSSQQPRQCCSVPRNKPKRRLCIRGHPNQQRLISSTNLRFGNQFVFPVPETGLSSSKILSRRTHDSAKSSASPDGPSAPPDSEDRAKRSGCLKLVCLRRARLFIVIVSELGCNDYI